MGANSGRYSKFQERLKKIVKNRLKRKKKGVEMELDPQELQQQFINQKVTEIHNIMSREARSKKNNNVKNIHITKKVGKSRDDELRSNVGLEESTTFLENNNTYIPEGKRRLVKSREDLELFGIEVINKIKGSFEDRLDQIEVMQSELYLLNVAQNETFDIKKLEEIKKKINELIEEINKIIDEYNLYNKNYYMDNFIGIEDRIIEDDIIAYRELLDSSSKEKDFVKEYKMLDEFKKLYSNLVIIKHDTEVLREKNEDKINEFDIRDKKYKYVVDDVVKIGNIEKDCLEKIEMQNKYLSELASKIDIIEKNEYVTTRLKGLGELVGQSLKFVGLKLLSPFSGIIPNIAVNTLMTKKLINNIYQNLHYEDVKHVYYSAINYDSELSSRIVDIGYTEDLIDSTLSDIKRLKEEFCLQYNSNIPGYIDTLKKINEIENIIYRNQNKVSMVKSRLIKNKKINEDKLIKVKKMNEKKN